METFPAKSIGWISLIMDDLLNYRRTFKNLLGFFQQNYIFLFLSDRIDGLISLGEIKNITQSYPIHNKRISSPWGWDTLGNIHTYTEKIISPFSFTVNGIWSWWQFLNQMKFIFGSKTVTAIISHSLWKAMEI